MFDSLFKKYKRIIFFDTETTGFNAEKVDQIIELAAISIDADGTQKEMDEFIHLFKMEQLPPKSGEETLLVAHNAKFDLQFLAYSIYRNREKGKGWMMVLNDCDYLDTLTVYKDRRKYPHKLESAIVEYKLSGKVENSHRAIDDCKALMEVAKAMDEEKQAIHLYVNLFGVNKK